MAAAGFYVSYHIITVSLSLDGLDQKSPSSVRLRQDPVKTPRSPRRNPSKVVLSSRPHRIFLLVSYNLKYVSTSVNLLLQLSPASAPNSAVIVTHLCTASTFFTLLSWLPTFFKDSFPDAKVREVPVGLHVFFFLLHLHVTVEPDGCCDALSVLFKYSVKSLQHI